MDMTGDSSSGPPAGLTGAAMIVGMDLGFNCALQPDACTINPTVCINCDTEDCPPGDDGSPDSGCVLRDDYATSAALDGTGELYLNGKCAFFVEESTCTAPVENQECPPDGGECTTTSEPSPCAWAGGCRRRARASRRLPL